MRRIPSLDQTSLHPPVFRQSVTTNHQPRAILWQRLLRQCANRLGLVPYLRVMTTAFWYGPWRSLAIRYYQWRKSNQPLRHASASLFAGLDVASIVAQLETRGCAPGLQLPDAQVEAILNYSAQHNLVEQFNPDLSCKAIHELTQDPGLLAVVRAYLGAEPLLHGCHLYWTHPPHDDIEKQRRLRRQAFFHYDLADFKALAVFFYLTDVTPDCGPHVMIPGTHRRKTWRQMLSRFLSDEQAQAKFGDNIVMITGKRGSGFFEDLACYHKHAFGTQTRLVLSIGYVLQRQPEMRIQRTAYDKQRRQQGAGE